MFLSQTESYLFRDRILSKRKCSVNRTLPLEFGPKYLLHNTEQLVISEVQIGLESTTYIDRISWILQKFFLEN